MTTTLALDAQAAPSTFTRAAARACCICGKDLTDAASIESGIGPICRKRANEALARTFPCDRPLALRVLREAREKGVFARLPGVVYPTLDAIIADVEGGEGRADWRETIKRVEWVLSHQHVGHLAHTALYALGEALGYPASVALWRGDVVVGKATVEALGPTLAVRGPRPNPATRDALKRAGFYFNSTSVAWVATPRTQAAIDKARDALRIHYLAPEGLDEACATLAGRLAAAPTPAAPTTPAPAAVRMVRQDLHGIPGAYIYAPYNAAFVGELKEAIVWRERQWVPAEKAWWVARTTFARCSALLAKHYGVQVSLPFAP